MTASCLENLVSSFSLKVIVVVCLIKADGNLWSGTGTELQYKARLRVPKHVSVVFIGLLYSTADIKAGRHMVDFYSEIAWADKEQLSGSRNGCY